MPLEPGTRLGNYQILQLVGAGGMGEVYRAHDRVLQRDVAIKMLPEEFAREAERVARLEREARMLAQMNHPNIAFIHELKRENGAICLVMELVEGETLAQKLRRAALPLRDALRIFRQIALALESTHARGIIHRDLKPENVKITPEGMVKVLDFGLAKEAPAPRFEERRKPYDQTDTKTGPWPITEESSIVGTIPYMSPEQARGEPLDKRTDIWSFGCCLFEAISGRRAFEGSTASDIFVAVPKGEPDFGALPPGVPENIRKLLRRCLQKDLAERLRDIGDARYEIDDALERKPEAPAIRPGGIPGLFLALAVAAGVLVGYLLFSTGPLIETSKPTRRFAIELPPTETMALDTGPALSISSDGMHLVYTVHRGDSTELRLRSFDELDPRRVAGTEGAHIPFFEASGGSFGFFSKGQLYRMSPDDSAPVRLGEIANARGASWLGDRIILSSGTESGLSSMSSRSGKVDSLTAPELDTGERSHRWPEILPGGEQVLFTSWRKDGFDVKLVDVDGKNAKLLVENASDPRFTQSKHLLFVRDSAILAQAFDLSGLDVRGEATKMIEDVEYDPRTGAAFYDISLDGTLVYAPREERPEDEVVGRLLIVDAGGKASLLNPVPRSYQVPRLSPSGKSVLNILTDRGGTDVWLMDRDRGTLSRITANGQSGVAVWHPGGDRIAYSSLAEGAFNIFVKSLDSAAPERRLTRSANTQFPTSWSVDGLLAYVELDVETQLDVWIWNEKTGNSEPFLTSPFQESAAVFSPDGKYIAYVSDETGKDQVYVSEIGSRRKWPISPDGGSEPVWSRDGTKLFYRNGDWVMRVDIATEQGFQPDVPKPFVEAPFDEAGVPYANYDVTPEDELVMVRTDEGRDTSRLIVVTDWFTELEKAVPSR